jgi:hypothetical protein
LRQGWVRGEKACASYYRFRESGNNSLAQLSGRWQQRVAIPATALPHCGGPEYQGGFFAGEGVVIAAYIDEFIMVCVGIWMTGVGFGFFASPFQAPPGPQPWWMTVARHFKWMGPLLIVIAVVLAVAEPG